MWIKRYIDNKDAIWKSILNHYLQRHGKEFFCYCNYDKKHLPPGITQFYTECLMQWQKIITDINYRQTHASQIIWNNKEITINKETVYYSDFRQAGLWTTSDLYEHGKVRGFSFWKSKGIKNNKFLLWAGLIDAIPQKYKKEIKEENPDLGIAELRFDSEKVIWNAKSRDFYKIFRDKHFIRPTSEKYYTYSEEDWKKIYLIPWQTFIDTKPKSFQYSFINRSLSTNSFLFKIGKIDKNTCTFCQKDEETLEHLFFYCDKTKRFWNEVTQNILQTQGKFKIVLNDVMLGITKEKNVLSNEIIILAKQCIWESRYKQTEPSLQSLNRKLTEYYSYERNFYNKQNKTKECDEKWETLVTYIRNHSKQK